MTQTTETLHAIWRSVRNRPAWISRLVERLGLDAGDEGFLNDTEDAFLLAAKELEGQWRRDVADRVRQFREEVDGEWARERRKDYLRQAITNIDQEISGLSLESPDGAARDEVARAFGRMRVQDLEHQKARLARELRFLSGRVNGKGLDAAQIEKARAFPLAELVETKRGMMLCPLHEDKHPSMLVRRGFGYCFSCGGRLDSIGYLMRVRGLRFREAVEALQ